jgi:RNA exonuclease 4
MKSLFIMKTHESNLDVPISRVRAFDTAWIEIKSHVNPSEAALSQSFSSPESFPLPPNDNNFTMSHQQAYVSPGRLPERSVPFMHQRVVAVDCEMVGIGAGGMQSILARVSLVDFAGCCLLDKYVQVNEPVTDYRTSISGVTSEDLKSSDAISFKECQKLVQELILNKILVGHGLKNDLEVLQISHPWYMIRDTSMYQPYMKTDTLGRLRPHRLKDLARAHLGIKIQQHGQPHDSKEDAAAAMNLYRNFQIEWDFAMDCKRRNASKQCLLSY